MDLWSATWAPVLLFWFRFRVCCVWFWQPRSGSFSLLNVALRLRWSWPEYRPREGVKMT